MSADPDRGSKPKRRLALARFLLLHAAAGSLIGVVVGGLLLLACGLSFARDPAPLAAFIAEFAALFGGLAAATS